MRALAMNFKHLRSPQSSFNISSSLAGNFRVSSRRSVRSLENREALTKRFRIRSFRFKGNFLVISRYQSDLRDYPQFLCYYVVDHYHKTDLAPETSRRWQYLNNRRYECIVIYSTQLWLWCYYYVKKLNLSRISTLLANESRPNKVENTIRK